PFGIQYIPDCTGGDQVNVCIFMVAPDVPPEQRICRFIDCIVIQILRQGCMVSRNEWYNEFQRCRDSNSREQDRVDCMDNIRFKVFQYMIYPAGRKTPFAVSVERESDRFDTGHSGSLIIMYTEIRCDDKHLVPFPHEVINGFCQSCNNTI